MINFDGMKTFLIVSLFAVSVACAQDLPAQMTAEENLARGRDLYNANSVHQAIPFFQEAVRLAPTMPEALYFLGVVYRYTMNYEGAVQQFKKLESVSPDYFPWFYYEEGVSYEGLKQFDNAVKSYQTFIAKSSNDPTRTNYLHQARFRINYIQKQKDLAKIKPTIQEASKMGLSVNSKFDDYMPAMDPTGTKIYFTSKRLGGITPEDASMREGDEDIYFIEKINGQWGAPQALPSPINSPTNEGAACFSADGQLMVYTGCTRSDGIGNCDLYIATLEGDHWTQPKNMGNVVNSQEWDSQPTISPDGNRIIFCSARAGGYGAEDLYMIEKNSFGEWGPPMNLGGVVNTPFSDDSPFLAQDGKTLYFGSKGHPGFGGYDIFKTTYENGKWSEPVNMGKPLNTEGDDNYFTIGGAGEKGYFSSNRGEGQVDLYEISIPAEMRPQTTVVVEGVVTDAKTKKDVDALVTVEDLNSGELLAVNRSNSATGKYLVVLLAGRTYSVSASKDGYFFHSERFDVPLTGKYETIEKNISLRPFEKGASVVLNNIFFETGKATLSNQSRLELEKAITLLNANPKMKIEIGGHTDNVSDDAFNLKLSQDRAKSVRDYLIKGGIAPVRLVAKGYGESAPIETNDTEAGRQSNRRTEFKILEF